MKKLLVVGNIQNFMAAGKNILNRAEFKIFTAKSAEEALDIHKTQRADLIITELDMPGISGDKLCSMIRKDEELKRVSILIVCTSAASDLARVSRCKANSEDPSLFPMTSCSQHIQELIKLATFGSEKEMTLKTSFA